MHRRIWAIGLFYCFFPPLAEGQFSSFASVSYGGHTNPLYNYQRIRDNLTQGYLEARYSAPIRTDLFEAAYVGGLILFSDITDRNYLEHRLRCSFVTKSQISFPDSEPSIIQLQPLDDSKEEPEEETEVSTDDDSDEAPSDLDSTRSHFEIALTGSARHDKLAFREFDNTGLTLNGSYRFPLLKGTTLRFSPATTYRSYRILPELSNISAILALTLRHHLRGDSWIGVSFSAGVKHFPDETYDTTRFESLRTYVVKSTGKGKAGAKLVVPSEKGLLVNASTTTSTQISAGSHISWARDGSLLELEALFRWNPGSSIRYLAQYTNTSTLTEDIYHDQFSYGGPELSLSYKQRIVFGIQAIIRIETARRDHLGPAFSLDGVQCSDHRQDLRSSLEIYVSRYIQLNESLGLDLALSGAVLRNQSQDAYNDYSLQQLSVSLGIGFF